MLCGTSMRRSLPPLVCATMLAALWLVFMAVPTEREMGIVQRIFYFHVASAWVACLGFCRVAGASAVYLWNGARTADRLAEAAAEVGVLFCTLVLVTGPIWARPVWGVWWTWDPRLTMTVILWAIYASYLMLRAFGGEDDAVRRYAAVLGIIGVLDIPIIMVSVRLLRGIHPAVLTRNEGGSGLVDPWMRLALLVSSVALILLGVRPDAVVWPLSTDEVATVIRFAVEHRVPVTARGAGSSLEGNPIPVRGGIVLDCSLMAEVVAIRAEDLQVDVQPGVVYAALNRQLRPHGLFFPPSPGGSADVATIGGMAANNAS